MPRKKITVDGREWSVATSGFVTQYDQDEYGLLFTRGAGDDREMRVTRYSPLGARSREASFAELSEEKLVELFAQSQPGFTSPEAGYSR
ncbi:MAG TPA: hypothetical protein VMY38_07800 [Gemmatimonadaceae bacterium]|nr:hypothetical protein [Gemmatimonadaceae bacterium]